MRLHIVKPTEPPGMAIVVDTIVSGVVTLSLQRADVRYNRVDAVYGGKGAVRIVTGVPAYQPMIPRLDNMRLLATIYVPYLISEVRHHMITEMV